MMATPRALFLLQVLQKVFGIEHGDERGGGSGDDDDGRPGTFGTKNIRLSIQKNRKTAPQRGRVRYLSSGWAGVWLGKLKRKKRSVNSHPEFCTDVQSSIIFS